MFWKRLGVGVLVLALTSACSTYRGPLPDYSYVGTAADTEIQKFTLKEGFFHQGAHQFAMGPEERRYWLSSLRPLIAEVSPRSVQRLEKADRWHRVALVSIAAALVILLSTALDGDDAFLSRDQSLAYWPLLGLSLGASITRTVHMDRATREYNQDLRAKFTSTLGLKFDY